MAEDICRKSAIIETYVMDSRIGNTHTHTHTHTLHVSSVWRGADVSWSLSHVCLSIKEVIDWRLSALGWRDEHDVQMIGVLLIAVCRSVRVVSVYLTGSEQWHVHPDAFWVWNISTCAAGFGSVSLWSCWSAGWKVLQLFRVGFNFGSEQIIRLIFSIFLVIGICELLDRLMIK